jgi:hypothetical protein
MNNDDHHPVAHLFVNFSVDINKETMEYITSCISQVRNVTTTIDDVFSDEQWMELFSRVLIENFASVAQQQLSNKETLKNLVLLTTSSQINS